MTKRAFFVLYLSNLKKKKIILQYTKKNFLYISKKKKKDTEKVYI